jgi:hypothetical protein
MSDLILGPVIITKYCCATNNRESRVLATHKRDNGTTWRCYLNVDNALSDEENHLKAAEKLLASWPYENNLKIVGRGHDASNYYFLCQSA